MCMTEFHCGNDAADKMAAMGVGNTVKPVFNDHLFNKIS